MELEVKVTLANLGDIEGQLAKLVEAARERLEAGEGEPEDGEPETEQEPEVESATVEIDGVEHRVMGPVDPDRA